MMSRTDMDFLFDLVAQILLAAPAPPRGASWEGGFVVCFCPFFFLFLLWFWGGLRPPSGVPCVSWGCGCCLGGGGLLDHPWGGVGVGEWAVRFDETDAFRNMSARYNMF